MKIIGICGVSGSGKSTIANYLAGEYKDKIALLSLNDYFKRTYEFGVPRDQINWEDPTSIKFEKLISDLKDLKAGKEIVISSKSRFYNPAYNHNAKNMIEVKIIPKEIILLEGFLILTHPELRDLLDTKIYLDLSIEKGLERRDNDKNKPSEEYVNKNILPSFKENILNKKKYADHVVDVEKQETKAVIEEIKRIITLV